MKILNYIFLFFSIIIFLILNSLVDFFSLNIYVIILYINSILLIVLNKPYYLIKGILSIISISIFLYLIWILIVHLNLNPISPNFNTIFSELNSNLLK